MAMAQRPRPGWASYHYYPAYHQHNNNCQDVGNSILLLLGLIICINIGINMVTLVRARPSRMTDNAGGRRENGWDLGGHLSWEEGVTVFSPT